MRFDNLGHQINHLGRRVDRLEGDMGSLRSHLSILEYVHPAWPLIPTAPTTFHPMPCLNLEDCDNLTDEDNEDADDDDGA